MEHTVAISWAFLIPAFPLLGFTINCFFGKRLQDRFGKGAVHAVAIGAMVASTAVAWGYFARMLALPAEDRYLHDELWNLFTMGSLRVELAFAFDPLSMMMTLIVTNVATLIHIFSVGYMADEPAYWRFFCYLNLFVFSMLLLVMGSNFVILFFGWEGVGLCSYLLISFWYQDLEKAKAGMKAFVVNRIGDFAFIIGLFALLWGLGGGWADARLGSLRQRDAYVANHVFQPFHDGADELDAAAHQPLKMIGHGPRGRSLLVGPTLDFRELREEIVEPATGMLAHLKHTTIFGFSLLAFVCILFFAGATGKSAQIPLYVWLPDAMAGPTPVSALIHAATMVTAGVYMVCRLNFLFSQSPMAMTVVASVGTLTALFAATIGLFQVDIKKVLAYSTVSQLGYMFIGVGVGAYWAGAYHLLTHAFFKACLFLGSGSVILACHHEQDMRKMGGLREYTPLTRWTYAVACLAISGFPVASGFFSKDEILWKAYTSQNLAAPWIGPVLWLVGLVAAGGTSFYMWRSYYLTFWSGQYRGAGAEGGHGHDAHDSHGHTPHESPAVMTWVLLALAAGAVLASFLGLPKAWGFDPALESFLEPTLGYSDKILRFADPGRGTELLFMGISVAVATLGWLLAAVCYRSGESPLPARALAAFPRVHQVIFDKFYVDEIYAATAVRLTRVVSVVCAWFDGHVIDALVNLAGWVVRFVANIDGAIDKYLVDGLVNLLAELLLALGRSMRRLQTGRLENYLVGALAGALAFVAINYMIH
ncbi:MAG: NADH-quinone oxidoreductase subunit L [Myxococcales bacterium]